MVMKRTLLAILVGLVSISAVIVVSRFQPSRKKYTPENYVIATYAEKHLWINSVAFFPDMHRLAAVGNLDRLVVHDLTASDKEQASRWIAPVDGPYQCVAVSPDCKLMAVARRGNAPGTWDEIVVLDTSNWLIITTFKGHENVVKNLQFSTDGRFLVSASADSTIRVHEVEKKSTRSVFTIPRMGFLDFVVEKDMVIALYQASDKTRCQRIMLSLESGLEVGPRTEITCGAEVTCGIILPKVHHVAMGLHSNSQDRIVVLDGRTGMNLVTFPESATGRITSIVSSPEGQLLAVVGMSPVVTILDTTKGKELAELAGLEGLPRVAFSPTNRTLATWEAHDLVLWDLARFLP